MIGINFFISYSHKDELFHNELASHLKLFERKGEIKSWYDRLILPGADWKSEINTHIYSADIILLLVSADFMGSDYCYNKELERALFQHYTGRSVLIPIIVRSIEWSNSSFGKIQALPTDGKPVTIWQDRDAAWKNVVGGILKVAEGIRKRKEQFFENIPSILQKFANDRADFTSTDDTIVNRNIKRLDHKYPDIWKSISEYRDQVETYGKKLTEAIWKSYDETYGSYRKGEAKFHIYQNIDDVFDLQLECISKEIVIMEKLEKEDLKASLFGFPDSKANLITEMNVSVEHKRDLFWFILKNYPIDPKFMFFDFRNKAEGEDFEEK